MGDDGAREVMVASNSQPSAQLDGEVASSPGTQLILEEAASTPEPTGKGSSSTSPESLSTPVYSPEASVPASGFEAGASTSEPSGKAASSPPRNGVLEEPSVGKRDASLARTDKSQDSSPNLSPNQSPVGSLIRDSSQVNAISVLTLLDKLLHMVEGVQEAQHSMEARQGEVEKAVSLIQGEVADFSKAQAETGATVRQVLDKARKVSANVKDVRARLEKQSHDVKKLENNHAELIKRSNFRIMVYQEGSDTPTSAVLARRRPPPGVEAGEVEEGVDAQDGQEGEASPTWEVLDLSEDEDLEMIEAPGSKAARLRKSGQKGVDTLRKAFSRHTLEKRVNKLVSPERREKIRQTLTLRPGHSAPSQEAPAAEGHADEGQEAHGEEEIFVSDGQATANAPGAPEKTTNKRIDTMKRALTRQSIEKKVNKLGMKIVPQDRRDKIRKSFVPEHKKPTRANVSSFKVPPFKFTVKKIREGDVVEMEEYQIDAANVEFLQSDGSLSDVNMEEVMQSAAITLDSDGKAGQTVPLSFTVRLGENEEPAVLTLQQKS
ncbi:caveolae-associated protein 1-like [Lampetra fluviatilis]